MPHSIFPDDLLVRIVHLQSVLGVSSATISTGIDRGDIPPPDVRTCGNARTWRISTLRAWRPDIAEKIETLLQNNVVPLAPIGKTRKAPLRKEAA